MKQEPTGPDVSEDAPATGTNVGGGLGVTASTRPSTVSTGRVPVTGREGDGSHRVNVGGSNVFVSTHITPREGV